MVRPTKLVKQTFLNSSEMQNGLLISEPTIIHRLSFERILTFLGANWLIRLKIERKVNMLNTRVFIPEVSDILSKFMIG